MKNKKVLAIVMAVMTAASALVGCGSTGATAPADTAATTEKKDDATAEAAQTTDGEQVTSLSCMTGRSTKRNSHR